MTDPTFTCPRCGWMKLPTDTKCQGCFRLDERERERARSVEGSDSRYLRIVNGKRVYSDTPPRDTIHDPHASKRKLDKENYS